MRGKCKASTETGAMNVHWGMAGKIPKDVVALEQELGRRIQL